MKSTVKPLNARDLVLYLISSMGLVGINWGFQTKIAKSLLTDYTYEELKYAIDYYKNQGIQIKSLGFLSYKNNMKDPSSLYNAERYIEEGDNSGERNRQRIAINREAGYRTECPEYLFTQSDEDD